MKALSSALATVGTLAACAVPPVPLAPPAARMPATLQVHTTAQGAPARLALTATVTPVKGAQPPEGDVSVFVNPAQRFQTVLGVGGAITDASAEVFARLAPAAQAELLTAYFDGERGIGYSLLRTTIHSSDFSSASYTYVAEGDSSLASFDVAPDRRYRLPMLRAPLQAAGGSVTYFQRHRTGDLMSRATNDLNAVRMTIGPAVMYTATTVLTFVVAVTMMFSLNVRLTLAALLALPLVTVSVRYFGRAIHERFERIQSQLSELSAIAQEALSGVRVVRAYRQEAVELSRFREANEEYVRRNRALIGLQGAFYPSMTFFLGVGALVVLWFGSREVISERLSIGEFVAFNAYLAMLSWPMIAFGWVTNLAQRGLASSSMQTWWRNQ